jgi:hypothetical protein
MIICHENSGQSKIEHFKFKVDLAYALLIEDANEIKSNWKSIIPLPKRIACGMPNTRKETRGSSFTSYVTFV